jgi:hypothetical protein
VPYEIVKPSSRLHSVEGASTLNRGYEAGVDSHAVLHAVRETKYPVKTPDVDPTNITHDVKGYFPIVQALALVGDDKKSMLDLDELGSKLVYPEMKKFLHETGYENILTQYKGLFHVRYYKDGVIQSSSDLTIDKDLVIKSKKELNLREVHHVVLYVAHAFEVLNDPVVEKLLKYNDLMRSVAGIAYRKSLISKIIHDGIVGTRNSKGRWINGVTSQPGYKFLYTVLAGADAGKLVIRNKSWIPNDNASGTFFDSIWTDASIMQASGNAETGHYRTLQQSYVETKTL